jgi:hypothetical protein
VHSLFLQIYRLVSKGFPVWFLALSLGGCATYADAILGTNLTFNDEGLLEQVRAELPEDAAYYEIRALEDADPDKLISSIPTWLIQSISVTKAPDHRQGMANRTLFFAEYDLVSSSGQAVSHTEERVHNDGSLRSTPIRDVFLERYYPVESVAIEDETYYELRFVYVDSDISITFGSRVDVFGGQDVVVSATVLSAGQLPTSSRAYEAMYDIGGTPYFFESERWRASRRRYESGTSEGIRVATSRSFSDGWARRNERANREDGSDSRSART